MAKILNPSWPLATPHMADWDSYGKKKRYVGYVSKWRTLLWLLRMPFQSGVHSTHSPHWSIEQTVINIMNILDSSSISLLTMHIGKANYVANNIAKWVFLGKIFASVQRKSKRLMGWILTYVISCFGFMKILYLKKKWWCIRKETWGAPLEIWGVLTKKMHFFFLINLPNMIW